LRPYVEQIEDGRYIIFYDSDPEGENPERGAKPESEAW
jgi:hypothetical protein